MWSVPCGPRGIKSNYAIYGRKGNYRIGIKVHSGSCGSCEIYAAFVLIKFLSLRINSETEQRIRRMGERGEMSRETKHVRINLKTDDGARKTKTKTNSEPKQLYAIYAVVMKGGGERMGRLHSHHKAPSHPHGNTNKLRVR